MGDVIRFRRPKPQRPRKRRRVARVLPIIGLLALAGGFVFADDVRRVVGPSGPAIGCDRPRVIDGDTLDCGGVRVRLAHIDAPEMPGHCRPGRTCTPGDPFAARDRLVTLTRGPVSCEPIDTDAYGRTVARCATDAGDLSCAMVEGGFAVRRYGLLLCFQGLWPRPGLRGPIR